MTFTEQKTLDFLEAMRERIESGAYRIIAADITSGLGDCLVMRIPQEKSSYSFVSTLRIELEPIPEAKRVPPKTI